MIWEGYRRMREMKEKMAGKLVQIAEKAAYKSVGKSIPSGLYEIKPPVELLERKKANKK